MKVSYSRLLSTVLALSVVVSLGCETGNRTASPTASPSASPTATPSVSDALLTAQDKISRALSELRSRNLRGSLELVDAAISSLRTAAGGAGAVSRTAIDGAVKSLETARAKIAGKDKQAEEALAKVEKTVSTLVESASSLLGDMKQKAAGAIGAAADAVKTAVSPSPSASPKKGR